MSPMMIIA